jgi:hypothetical protein
LEKGLLVVVIVGDVVALLGDSALAPPHPAAKTTTAVLQHTVIASCLYDSSCFIIAAW